MILVRQVLLYFWTTADGRHTMARRCTMAEWNRLAPESKNQLRQGLTDGTLTY